ncbi:futalosine hydrolase [Pseudodesulfovibrio senegalensis]|uniref:Futalosine hydrolase n=1 Tax=Pseudodesulfovibrio senegalensis TaxID=1721087 RepID=A0A6N6N4Q3_9BACT|nr:futalosine hydrolase [Pseudodesulfovibrio senegalensis]KAB1442721.1 futalosine hydrolase [Pseudodesulfovibrio senegalensis]
MLALVAATHRELRACLAGAGIDLPDGDALEQGGTARISVHGRELLACTCGVGLVNAGIMLGRLLERGVAGVVNVGIAGSFDVQAAPLGSVWLAKSETWPEYGVLDENGMTDARALKFPLARVGGEAVWDRVALNPYRDAEAMGLHADRQWGEADFLSVSGVSAATERAHGLRKRFDVLLENMEGFALAFGCAVAGVPFVELRTVSNRVGSRERTDWDIEGALAALGNACTGLLSGRREDSPLF